MKDIFGLDESAMLNDPRSHQFAPGLVIEVDGNMLFAKLTTFVNLQESPAGFGKTAKEAVENLLVNMKRSCHKAMWWGYGAPAGICGEPAYTDEIHPNSLAMILCDGVGRCPKHGGFDLHAAAALALYYRASQDSRDRAIAFESETQTICSAGRGKVDES